MRMILIIPQWGVSHVKFYINPLALRARSLRSVVQYRMFTVIHSANRASEASGFSTVGHYCECLRICVRVTVCKVNSLHSYNIARIRPNGTVLVCILTVCNIRNRCAEILNSKHLLRGPLASLARFKLYHAVTICIVARIGASEHEVRADCNKT